MKNWIQAIRLGVFSASVFPALLGVAIAFNETGKFNGFLMIMTVFGIGCIHAGANLINEYFDAKSGADAANEEFLAPLTGGSRIIMEGKLSPSQVLRGAVLSFILGAGVGLYLFYISGIFVLGFMLFGLITAVVYTTPKINLINIGLGEVAIGLDFGILTVLGSYYVQTGRLSFSAFMVSVPVGIVIAGILFINEFQDYKGDKAVGKRTTVVRLGRKKASRVLVVYMASVIGFLIVDILFGYIPKWGWITIFSWPFFYRAAMHTLKCYDEPKMLADSNFAVILGQLLLTILLALSFLISSSAFVWIPAVFVILASFKMMKQVHLFGSNGISRG